MILFKVEDFKHYNNTFGYAAANELLRSIAKVISKAIGNSGNLAARYDSEVFGVILPNTSDSRAIELGEIVRQNRKKLNHFNSQSKLSKKMTLSMGIASTIPKGNSSLIATLVIPAEQAMSQFALR